MHNSGLRTTEVKPIFKTKKLKGVIHLHPILNLSNLWACPFFKKPRHCSYTLKMGIPTHQEPVILCHLGMFDNVLLDSSWMPQVCLVGRHPLGCSWPGQTAAFLSLPEMLMWAGSRSGVTHRAAYQHLLPSVCAHTSPSFHPPAAFLSPGGLNKQGVSTGCRGACPPMLRDHLFLCFTQRGRQRGWITLPCQPGPPQERSWSFVFLGVKGASSSLITFNWVRPGFRAW